MAAVQTPAVLLRAHDYGDSSRILRFYTRDHGLLSVVARGVRGRSGKGATTLASFASGELTAYVKPQRDLHTMKDFHCTRLRAGIAADMLRFAGASAAGEVVLVHAEQEPQPPVFAALDGAFNALEEVEAPLLPGTAIAALWSIVTAFGFQPQLAACVRCHEPIAEGEMARFDFSAGGLRCEECGQDAAGPRIGPIARGQLDELLQGRVPVEMSHFRQHLALVSDFIAYHLAAKPLKSLRFLGSLLPADTVPTRA
ncbi:MAG: DNA repair protein RecO [Gemmatimonadota bacterium]